MLSSVAHAAPVAVGQLFAPNDLYCYPGGETDLVTGVAAGASYTVPVDGAITSWSYQDGSGTVPGLKVKVARAMGGGTYQIVGESTAGTQTANSVNTFTANIPVRRVI